MRVFENPHTGKRDYLGSSTVMWASVFGFMFYGSKGLWPHAAVILVAWVLGIYAGTVGWLISAVVSLVFGLLAPKFLADAYVRRGWHEV